MDIRVAGIQDDSVVDGEGIRMTVFSQGCPHHCHGCHNPATWNSAGGYVTTTEEILEQYKNNPLLDGMTFSGGEPFMQPFAFIELADRVHDMGGNIWCYTGFTLEQLTHRGFGPHKMLLDRIDVLVDGEYVKALRDLTLEFRGSSNQCIWQRRGTVWTPWKVESEAIA